MTVNDVLMVIGMTMAITLIIVVVSWAYSEPKSIGKPDAGVSGADLGEGASGGYAGHWPRGHASDHRASDHRASDHGASDHEASDDGYGGADGGGDGVGD